MLITSLAQLLLLLLAGPMVSSPLAHLEGEVVRAKSSGMEIAFFPRYLEALLAVVVASFHERTSA